MKSNPLLSIVTVNYNNADGLQKTLASIFDSKSSFVESIVIDGNSTDDSKKVIENFSAQLAYAQSKPDKGIYDAMNIGLSKSRGTYVWFLNSADLLYDSSTLEKLLPFLQKGDEDIIYGDAMVVDVNYAPIGLRSEVNKKPLPKLITKNVFRYGMSISHQSLIVKKSMAPSYKTKYKHVSDIDWFLNIIKQPTKSIKVNFPLSRIVNEGHSSQNRNASNKERFKVLAKHYGWIPNFFNHIRIALKKGF